LAATSAVAHKIQAQARVLMTEENHVIRPKASLGGKVKGSYQFCLFHAKILLILLILSKFFSSQVFAEHGLAHVFIKNHNFFENSSKNLLTT
jgi:hypothetical protein